MHRAPRTGRHVTLALIAIVLCSTAATALGAPAVAFVSRQFIYLEDYDALPDLRDAGFEVGALDWKDVSPETLQPFNVVVLTDIPGANEVGELAPHVAAAAQHIRAWAQAGGGVLAGTPAAWPPTWYSSRGTWNCWTSR